MQNHAGWFVLKISERSYRESDREWLWNLYESSLKAYIEEQWGWDEDYQTSGFFNKLPISKFKILSLGGSDVAAYLLLEEIDHFYVKMILVAEGFRNTGIGHHLMTKICKNASEVARPVRLSVISCNPAISLYKRLGFVVTSIDDGSTYMSYGE